MSMTGDLDEFESAARGRQSRRQVAETHISSQPAKKTSKRTVSDAALTLAKSTEKRTVSKAIHFDPDKSSCSRAPDTHLRFPRLWYDSSCQLATVVAAPSPLHSDMVGEEVMRRGGISENIQEGFTVSSATTNCADAGNGLTIREWDGAISDVVDNERTLMVAFEVGGSRGERSKVQYYASEQEARAAIQRARDEIRRRLRHYPLGPLVWNGVIVRDGRFSEQDVPPLNGIVLGDCVPTHILSSSEILATPLGFFRRSWFESKIRTAILDTAVLRISRKTKAKQRRP
ncbi:hypothetical protein V1508DRAFT_456305 [Lipomyces doorenjongii]|uniref:uncharacterized protein n=1 Tax=Lipomyces doorenjongii TaxID=383834 RepID=UPI0034CFC2F1